MESINIVPIFFSMFFGVLAIIFVASHRRLSIAHEELASAHIEIAQQLLNISKNISKKP